MRTCGYTKSFISIVTLLFIIVISSVQITSADHEIHYYAGGLWLVNQPGEPGKDIRGVKGEIYTINPDIPDTPGDPTYVDFVAEFINLGLGPPPGSPGAYWVQIGYSKGEDSHPKNTLEWYYEKKDEFDPGDTTTLIWLGEGPAPGTWHTYEIFITLDYTPEGKRKFTISIDGVEKGSLWIRPSRVFGLDGEVETTNGNIDISGSYFRNLQYSEGGGPWKGWGSLTTCASRWRVGAIFKFYMAVKISNTEFMASGPYVRLGQGGGGARPR